MGWWTSAPSNPSRLAEAPRQVRASSGLGDEITQRATQNIRMGCGAGRKAWPAAFLREEGLAPLSRSMWERGVPVEGVRSTNRSRIIGFGENSALLQVALVVSRVS